MLESADFSVTMRHGARAGTEHLVVHLLPQLPQQPDQPADGNPPVSTTLVGFAVSKQVGTAVVRNTVRRRLRHLVRARIDGLPVGRIVVRALPGSVGASSEELGRSFDSAVARALRKSGPRR